MAAPGEGPVTETPEDRPAAGRPPSDTDLQAQVEDLKAKLEATAKQVLYLTAEAENVRKAATRERTEFARFAAQDLLARLLPILDELDAAFGALPEEHGRGVRLVRDNLAKALTEAGLKEIAADHQRFDPYLHEAVEVVTDSPLEDGTVMRVLRKGYTHNARVLRPSLVAVVKKGGAHA